MDYELMLGNVLILLDEVWTKGSGSVQNMHTAMQLIKQVRADVIAQKGRGSDDHHDGQGQDV